MCNINQMMILKKRQRSLEIHVVEYDFYRFYWNHKSKDVDVAVNLWRFFTRV